MEFGRSRFGTYPITTNSRWWRDGAFSKISRRKTSWRELHNRKAMRWHTSYYIISPCLVDLFVEAFNCDQSYKPHQTTVLQHRWNAVFKTQKLSACLCAWLRCLSLRFPKSMAGWLWVTPKPQKNQKTTSSWYPQSQLPTGNSSFNHHLLRG